MAHNRAQADGTRFGIRHPQHKVFRTLEITGAEFLCLPEDV
jgi:hypothetical protein